MAVIGPGVIGNGSGYRIGDGYVLTAGHIVFEWNQSFPIPPVTSTTGLNHTGIITSPDLDYRNYEQGFINYVNATFGSGFVAALPANAIIEAQPETASKDFSVK